jgi:hypothetical protein
MPMDMNKSSFLRMIVTHQAVSHRKENKTNILPKKRSLGIFFSIAGRYSDH